MGGAVVKKEGPDFSTPSTVGLQPRGKKIGGRIEFSKRIRQKKQTDRERGRQRARHIEREGPGFSTPNIVGLEPRGKKIGRKIAFLKRNRHEKSD